MVADYCNSYKNHHINLHKIFNQFDNIEQCILELDKVEFAPVLTAHPTETYSNEALIALSATI